MVEVLKQTARTHTSLYSGRDFINSAKYHASKAVEWLQRGRPNLARRELRRSYGSIVALPTPARVDDYYATVLSMLVRTKGRIRVGITELIEAVTNYRASLDSIEDNP